MFCSAWSPIVRSTAHTLVIPDDTGWRETVHLALTDTLSLLVAPHDCPKLNRIANV